MRQAGALLVSLRARWPINSRVSIDGIQRLLQAQKVGFAEALRRGPATTYRIRGGGDAVWCSGGASDADFLTMIRASCGGYGGSRLNQSAKR